jgi:hypothetical protein
MDAGQLQRIREVVSLVRYSDWEFRVFERAGDAVLQLLFRDDEGREWKSRKWLLSEHATASEIVQTCLKAVLTAIEHEAREAFLFRGFPVFGPHHDVEALLNMAQQKRAG